MPFSQKEIKLASMKKLIIVILAFCCINHLQASDERFPPPSPLSVAEESEIITTLGKNEVLSLPLVDLSLFLWDRYVRGPGADFEYGSCNPKKLTPEEAKLPGTILLHACESNQGQWIPLIDLMEKQKCGAIFTYNYEQETDLLQLIHKIERIRKLYLEAGQPSVELNLVGHSLGAICAAEYAFNPKLWVENTSIKKVISIAGRLRNIEPPFKTPYYCYCYDVLQRVDDIWSNIQENRGTIELYTIAAGNDWLVPQESVLVGDDTDHIAIIPDKGHVLISRSPLTSKVVINWLFN